jgi:hypothetical protein
MYISDIKNAKILRSSTTIFLVSFCQSKFEKVIFAFDLVTSVGPIK